jgi:sugar-specific transcriptional regulator TrmB
MEKVLIKLGLRDEEIKTFLFLLENGEQTAGNLSKKTGLSRPSLYGFVRKLQKRGIVIESQKNGVKIFSASPKEKVIAILEEQIAELEKGKEEVGKIFDEIQKGGMSVSPKFQLFEGRDGVRNLLRDVLLYQNIQTMSYWPIRSIIDVVSEDYFSKLNVERIKRKIYVRAIWPQNQVVEIKKTPFMGGGENFFREIRIAPPEIAFSLGYWMYGDKVAFISSKKEAFGFIVESRELVEMLTSQFEVVWKTSKRLEGQEKDGELFLKENKLL